MRWPYVFARIIPADAQAERLKNGDIVVVYNDNSSVPAVVWISEVVKQGHVFFIMAYPYSIAANAVTTPSVEPVAQSPDYKLTKATLLKVCTLPFKLKAIFKLKDINFYLIFSRFYVTLSWKSLKTATN